MTIQTTSFYDLGESLKPFRLAPGNEIIITDVHPQSTHSKHLVGMKAVLVKGMRRWRCKRTKKTWATVELRFPHHPRTTIVSLCRLKAAEVSVSTLYRRTGTTNLFGE